MWEVDITLLNEDKKLARIKAIRTDPVTDEVFRYTCTAIIHSAEQRSAIIQRIKDEYIKFQGRQDRVETILSGLADTAANALNTWESN